VVDTTRIGGASGAVTAGIGASSTGHIAQGMYSLTMGAPKWGDSAPAAAPASSSSWGSSGHSQSRQNAA
jgi:hypothetical protein